MEMGRTPKLVFAQLLCFDLCATDSTLTHERFPQDVAIDFLLLIFVF